MSNLGPEFQEIWPRPGAALELTDFGRRLLEKCQVIEQPSGSRIDVEQFMLQSDSLPIKFGTDTCRVRSQPKERWPQIAQQIASAYPVIHERVLGLYLAFLEHKCKYGNRLEIEVFGNLSLTDFVQRLLAKRCASFFGTQDKFLLLSEERGHGGFEAIGTEYEKPPLVLRNVLSYDEMKLSAFLSVSSHSELINNGCRQNCGIIEKDKSKIERDGVVIGVIGARFARRGAMEFQDIVIAKAQNTKKNGYGLPSECIADTRESDYRRVWNTFYEDRDFVYDEVAKDGKRFGDSYYDSDIFDNYIMKKRYAISFDTLLLDSEARAAACGQSAYIHVVGIGLGVWRVAEQQEKIFLETFTQRLKALLPKLAHIAVVHFSWFESSSCGQLQNGGVFKSETHPQGGVRTFLSNRNPADKLQREYKDLLLIVSYASDGNALPGNEFWMRYLKSSGDSSTACSTLVTELHNPHINTEKVSGTNLHIASERHGVIHIADYAKKLLA